jgi:hypothetical protein
MIFVVMASQFRFLAYESTNLVRFVRNFPYCCDERAGRVTGNSPYCFRFSPQVFNPPPIIGLYVPVKESGKLASVVK